MLCFCMGYPRADIYYYTLLSVTGGDADRGFRAENLRASPLPRQRSAVILFIPPINRALSSGRAISRHRRSRCDPRTPRAPQLCPGRVGFPSRASPLSQGEGADSVPSPFPPGRGRGCWRTAKRGGPVRGGGLFACAWPRRPERFPALGGRC